MGMKCPEIYFQTVLLYWKSLSLESKKKTHFSRFTRDTDFFVVLMLLKFILEYGLATNVTLYILVLLFTFV